jgi:hypothetical protein
MHLRVEAPLPRICFLGHSDRGLVACSDAGIPRGSEPARVEGGELAAAVVAEVEVVGEVVAVCVGQKLLRRLS